MHECIKHLGEITLPGNNSAHIYSAFDENPPPGKIYYRIKFLERNNSISYSPVRQVTSGKNNEFVVYPNPATNKIIITGNYHYPAELQLLDLGGAVVFKNQILNSPAEILLPSLSAGVYLLSFDHAIQKLIIRQFFLIIPITADR